MRAEREDAPEYLRTKRPSPWRMIAIASTGTLLTFSALALMDFGIVIDVSKLKDAFQVHTASIPHTQSQPAPEAPVQTETPTSIAITPYPSYQATHPPVTQEHNVQGKQVVFNDYNYTPKPAANTYQTPSAVPIAEARPAQNQRKQRVTRSAHWKWENGYEKKRVSGRFEWIEVNGEIDLSSVCQNYRHGSFIYRDCRKGAKVAFNNMCGSYEPACYAGRNMAL